MKTRRASITLAVASLGLAVACSEQSTSDAETTNPADPADQESSGPTTTTAQTPPADQSAVLTASETIDLANDVNDARVAVTRLAAAGRAAADGRPVEALAPLIGRWEIDADWAWGEKLWGRSDYTPVLGGAFIEATAIVREDDQPPYHRYTSIIRVDPSTGAVSSTDFANNGSVQTSQHTPLEGGGLQSEWLIDEIAVRERIDPSDDSMPWQVWMKQPQSDEWSLVMDDAWTPTEADMPEHEYPALSEALTPLAPLLGQWTIEASWASGEQLAAHVIYSVDVGGEFIRAATFPKGPDGVEYHRDLSFFGSGKDGLEVRGFDLASNVTTNPVTMLQTDPPAFEISSSQPGGATLRQRIDLVSEDVFRWQVWTTSPNDDTESQIMDGSWKRVTSLGHAR